MKRNINIFVCILYLIILLSGCAGSALLDENITVQFPQEESEVGGEVESLILEGSVTAGGIKLFYEASNGKAVVHYPQEIPDSAVNAFFAYSFSKTPALLMQTFFTIKEPGIVEMTFSSAVPAATCEAFVEVLSLNLDEFTADYLPYYI